MAVASFAPGVPLFVYPLRLAPRLLSFAAQTPRRDTLSASFLRKADSSRPTLPPLPKSSPLSEGRRVKLVARERVTRKYRGKIG